MNWFRYFWNFIVGLFRCLPWYGVECSSNARIDGKIVIITGANRTIGKETALELARRGAGQIVLACRDMESAENAAEKIKQETGNQNIIPMHLDLSSFKSIKRFAEEFSSSHDHLDILISNAGISNGSKDRRLTIDGFEEHLQVHHLGPLYLINLLLPLMVKSSGPARIVLVTSSAHRIMLKFDLDNLNSDTFYYPGLCYCKSKLAAELIATHLAPKLMIDNVTINTLCPGAVYTDIMTRHPAFRTCPNLIGPILKCLLLPPRMGAQTVIYCSTDPSLDCVTGKHFMNCRQTLASRLARDTELAAKTYQKSMALIGKHLNNQ